MGAKDTGIEPILKVEVVVQSVGVVVTTVDLGILPGWPETAASL